jgi:hypothetical protein
MFFYPCFLVNILNKFNKKNTLHNLYIGNCIDGKVIGGKVLIGKVQVGKVDNGKWHGGKEAVGKVLQKQKAGVKSPGFCLIGFNIHIEIINIYFNLIFFFIYLDP